MLLVAAAGIGVLVVLGSWGALHQDQFSLDALIGQAIVIEITLGGFALVAATLLAVAAPTALPSGFAFRLGLLMTAAVASAILDWLCELALATVTGAERETILAVVAAFLLATAVSAVMAMGAILGRIASRES